MPAIDSRHLEALKTLVLLAAELKVPESDDCLSISIAIRQKTNYNISEVTVRRLFGFAVSRFSPSVFTLNALATFCGFESWMHFTALRFGTTVSGTLHEALMTALIDTQVPSAILQADDPDLTILTYNQAYERETNLQQRTVRGLPFWTAFDPRQAGGYGATILLEAFQEAIHARGPLQMDPLQYNIISDKNQRLEQAWWDIRIVPVVYDSAVKYLFLQVRNITDRMVRQDAIEQAIIRELTQTEDLAKSNVKLAEINTDLEQMVFERTQKLFISEAKQRALIDNAPVAIAVLTGPDHIIETANRAIIAYWGKTGNLIGLPLANALPELAGQPFIGILDEVRKSGTPYINKEKVAWLDFDGKLVPRYFDMVYQPIRHDAVITDSIFILAVDITDQVFARKRLEHSEVMLRLALTAASMGTWSFTPANHLLIHNSVFAHILGWTSKAQMRYEDILSVIIDPRGEALLREATEEFTENSEYDVVIEIRRHNDGRKVRVQVVGTVALDVLGQHKMFSGLLRELPVYPV